MSNNKRRIYFLKAINARTPLPVSQGEAERLVEIVNKWADRWGIPEYTLSDLLSLIDGKERR